MATGFVQRWKGKVRADRIEYGAGGLVGPRQTITASTAGTGTAISNVGVTLIATSSAMTAFTLGTPLAGAAKTVTLTTVSSGVEILAGTTQSLGTFDGVNWVLKSTGPTVNGMGVSLIGLSSIRWAITALFPGSTASNWTLSTAT